MWLLVLAVVVVATVDGVDDVAAIVVHAQRGDAKAFGQLYTRFARAVHAVILAKVPASEADDLVQEVFIAAHQGLSGLTDPRAFPGWIMTIARRRAVDSVRDRARRVTNTDNTVEIADSRDPRLSLEAKQALIAIRALPEAYAETLIMRLVEGLDGPQIAERTGLAPGSVLVNLHRGMALLRERLGGAQ